MKPDKVARFGLEDDTIEMTMTSCDDSVIVEVINHESEHTESFLMNTADCVLLDMFISEVVGRDSSWTATSTPSWAVAGTSTRG